MIQKLDTKQYNNYRDDLVCWAKKLYSNTTEFNIQHEYKTFHSVSMVTARL